VQEKTIVRLIFYLAMAIAIISAFPIHSYTDSSVGHWSEPYIVESKEYNWIPKDLGPSFDVDKRVSRAEMAYILWHAYGAVEPENKCPYSDVSENSIYADAFAFLYERKVVLGYSENLAGPYNFVTREMIFTILARSLRLKAEDPSAYQIFMDSDEVAVWACDAISVLCERMILNGDEFGNIRPIDDITFAELIKILVAANRKMAGYENNPFVVNDKVPVNPLAVDPQNVGAARRTRRTERAAGTAGAVRAADAVKKDGASLSDGELPGGAYSDKFNRPPPITPSSPPAGDCKSSSSSNPGGASSGSSTAPGSGSRVTPTPIPTPTPAPTPSPGSGDATPPGGNTGGTPTPTPTPGSGSTSTPTPNPGGSAGGTPKPSPSPSPGGSATPTQSPTPDPGKNNGGTVAADEDYTVTEIYVKTDNLTYIVVAFDKSAKIGSVTIKTADQAEEAVHIGEIGDQQEWRVTFDGKVSNYSVEWTAKKSGAVDYMQSYLSGVSYDDVDCLSGTLYDDANCLSGVSCGDANYLSGVSYDDANFFSSIASAIE